MPMLLHHSTDSGSTPARANDSSTTEHSLPQSPPAILPSFDGRLFGITAGLQNNMNRWYDPTPGRYLSEDPVGYCDDSDENLTKYVGQ